MDFMSPTLILRSRRKPATLSVSALNYHRLYPAQCLCVRLNMYRTDSTLIVHPRCICMQANVRVDRPASRKTQQRAGREEQRRRWRPFSLCLSLRLSFYP